MGPLHGEPRGDVREWFERQASWLDASRSEVVGLAVLLVGAVVATALFWWTGLPRPATPEEVAVQVSAPTPEPLLIHVSGAVARPGVVRLPSGARVADAIAAAGGPGPDAALDHLNLARELTDGEQVHVAPVGAPDASSGAEGTPEGGGGAGAWRPDGRLDINRATAADLEELPGIGPVLAERIVRWREENGSFTEVGDLREVSGIGERTYQQLADLVTR